MVLGTIFLEEEEKERFVVKVMDVCRSAPARKFCETRLPRVDDISFTSAFGRASQGAM